MNKMKLNNVGGRLYAVCMWKQEAGKKTEKSRKRLSSVYLPIRQRYEGGSSG